MVRASARAASKLFIYMHIISFFYFGEPFTLYRMPQSIHILAYSKCLSIDRLSSNGRQNIFNEQQKENK